MPVYEKGNIFSVSGKEKDTRGELISGLLLYSFAIVT
jgi:hypothetical protein